MHNSTRWSTPTAALTATAVGGLAMAGAALIVDLEPAGRVLVGIAALGLLVIAGLGARQRPRLAIRDDNSGIVVQRLTTRLDLDRDELSRVRITRYPRLGRRVPMLEIEVRPATSGRGETRVVGDERLLIFGRWDLGADPTIVFEALNARGLVPAEPRRG